MSKANNKTKQTDEPVSDYLKSIDNETRRRQAETVADIMASVTRRPATMWGKTIVGFGRYEYRYDSGREGEFMLTGFSSRKQNLTIYIMTGFDQFEAELEALGPHKLGKSCLYLKDLDKTDLKVLRKMIRQSVATMRKRYKCD